MLEFARGLGFQRDLEQLEEGNARNLTTASHGVGDGSKSGHDGEAVASSFGSNASSMRWPKLDEIFMYGRGMVLRSSARCRLGPGQLRS